MPECNVTFIHRGFNCCITKANTVHRIKLYLYVTLDTIFTFIVI